VHIRKLRAPHNFEDAHRVIETEAAQLGNAAPRSPTIISGALPPYKSGSQPASSNSNDMLAMMDDASAPPIRRPMRSVRHTLNILGMGRTKFYAKLNAGEICAVKIGRRTLVPDEEIEKFVQSLKSYRSVHRSD
jgi:excisionase family DNA binding protein